MFWHLFSTTVYRSPSIVFAVLPKVHKLHIICCSFKIYISAKNRNIYWFCHPPCYVQLHLHACATNCTFGRAGPDYTLALNLTLLYFKDACYILILNYFFNFFLFSIETLFFLVFNCLKFWLNFPHYLFTAYIFLLLVKLLLWAAISHKEAGTQYTSSHV